MRVFRLAEALAHRGHAVHVVTYHLGNETGPLPFRIHRIPNVGFYRKVAPGPTYPKLLVLDVLLAAKLSRILSRRPIDVIHAHHYEGLLAALWARRRGQPLVYDAHTRLETELPFYGLGLPKRFKRSAGRFLDRWLPRRAMHVTATTDEIKESLVRDSGVAPGDVTVVPSGVEGEHFEDLASGEDGEERVAFCAGNGTLAFAGNLAPYQRIDLLLSSFREILNERPGVRLHIISDSPFDPYEAQARDLEIRGQIDVVRSDFADLPGHLATVDVALNPRTDCDGLPQKLLNYMAAGKPIVSFEGSGRVLVHGATGWVVANEDVRAFARGVLGLLDDAALARKMGANARRHVLEEYSWSRAAEKMESVYRAVCAR